MRTHNGTHIYYNCSLRARDVTQLIEYSAGTYKALGSILILPKQCVLEEYFITKQRTQLNIAKRQRNQCSDNLGYVMINAGGLQITS